MLGKHASRVEGNERPVNRDKTVKYRARNSLAMFVLSCMLASMQREG